jgi:electron transfer flavoprotein alpha subunit
MTMKILVVAETLDDGIDPVSLELLTAARTVAETSDEVVAIAFAETSSTPAECLGSADRLICVEGANTDTLTPEAIQSHVLEILQRETPQLVLVAYSAMGLDLASWLAARAEMGLTAYVNALEHEGGKIVAHSQLYGGKMLARTELALPNVLSVTPGNFPEAPRTAAEKVEAFEPKPLENCHIQLKSLQSPELEGVNLTTSDRILCIGRGISDENGVEQARQLATLLSADLAGSRPVVDGGLLEKRRQVGKSGQKVKPKLYIALGVSGAPEHLEGMAGSEKIVAVNTDPDAPIFNVAHYSVNCDLFDFMQALGDRLEESPAETG